MKIIEIIEAAEKKLTVDQAAQLYAQHGDALPSSVIVLAKRIHANSGLDANDAISMAKELDSDRQKSTKAREPKRDNIARSPMTRTPLEPSSRSLDRTSKSGKKWGNQYYSDDPRDKPTKSQSSAKYRDLKKSVSDKIGKITKKDARDLGKDIAKDATGALDSIMNLGKRKNSR